VLILIKNEIFPSQKQKLQISTIVALLIVDSISVRLQDPNDTLAGLKNVAQILAQVEWCKHCDNDKN
jgi:hypothetical protein